jgi:thymidine phosphorylase
VAAGDLVEIAPARPPKCLDAVRAKIRGGTLTAVMIGDVVADLVSDRCSDMEIAAFLIACASFMTAEETLALTEAMVAVGARLS